MWWKRRICETVLKVDSKVIEAIRWIMEWTIIASWMMLENTPVDHSRNRLSGNSKKCSTASITRSVKELL